jgi:hypothetical protein
VKVVLGALGLTVAGAALGAGLGWLANPRPVALPDESLGFVNYVGPILGGSLGGTFGLIFGGGWFFRFVDKSEGNAV